MSDKKYKVHPSAIVETDDIGENTRIWAFVHILWNVKIGKDCNVCDHSFIENDVTIGDRVTIKNNIAIWTGVTIEDDVFLGPNCVLTNDMYPRSKGYTGITKTLIKKGATIGANATIICGHDIGSYAMVGAGAVVTKEVPDFALVAGNPARFMYWVSRQGRKLSFNNKGIAENEKGDKYRKSEENGKEKVELI